MLHGQVSLASQRQAFKLPRNGQRKIVLATNIAETSITVPDVVYVIDTGREKLETYDAVNNLRELKPRWVSKASANQRKGRAGRLQEGVCFRLYPQVIFDDHMTSFTDPEITRTPLSNLCLTIKSLGIRSP